MGYLISRAPPLDLPVMSAKKRRQGEKRAPPLNLLLVLGAGMFFQGSYDTAGVRGVMCGRKWRLNPLLGRGKGRQALGRVVTHTGPTPALR